MSTRRIGARTGQWLTGIIALPLLMIAVRPSLAAAIDPHDRVLLAESAAAGRSHITMLIATREGLHESFLSYAVAQGAIVRYADAALGYYRLRVPLESVFRIAEHEGVQGANLSAGMPAVRQSQPEAQPSPARDRPRARFNVQDYVEAGVGLAELMGIDEMGILRLRRDYPTFDGRGVTIAIIEQLPDFDAPELAMARAPDGTPVRKIDKAYAVLSFDSADPERVWALGAGSDAVRLSGPEFAAEGRLLIASRSVRMPEHAFYQTGYIEEGRLSRSQGSDYNRDGNPPFASRVFAIARRVGSDCLLIDVNQNDDLRDDSCLKEFNSDPRVHRIHSSARSEQGMPFIVLKSDDPDIWVIGAPRTHTHLAHVAAAGHNNLFGQELSPAPAAKIVSITTALDYTESLLEAIIFAAHQPDIDVIHSEYANQKRFTHSGTVGSIVIERIADRLNKVITAPVGNSLVETNISLQASSPASIAVGQLFAARQRRIFSGDLSERDVVPLSSSSAPTGDGRMKPDVIAPALGVFPITDNFQDHAERAFYNQLLCPNLITTSGYACFSGSSMSGPVVAGAVATLISAARQIGIPYKASDIHQAITMSARHVPGVPVHRQGNGVASIPEALEWLRAHASRAKIEISVSAPVSAALGAFLPRPNEGVGLYEQIAWKSGMDEVRNIRIRRTSGPEGEVIYPLRIIGDGEGAFSTPVTVTLPLDIEILVPVRITPKRDGHHSAFLEMGDAADPVARIPLNVIAARPLSAENNYRLDISSQINEAAGEGQFVYVPQGIFAVTVAADFAQPGLFMFAVPLIGAGGNIDPRDDLPVEKLGDPSNRFSVYNPSPGIWQIFPRQLEVFPNPTTFSARVTGLTTKQVLDATATPAYRKSSHEDGGALDPTSIESKVVRGRRRIGRLLVRQNEGPRVFDLGEISAQAIDIRAEAVSPSTSKRSISVAAFNCRDDRCYNRGVSIGDGRAGLIVYKPGPGRWRITIDVVAADGDATDVEYEVFAAVNDETGLCESRPDEVLTAQIRAIEMEDGCFTEIVSSGIVHRTYAMANLFESSREENVSEADNRSPNADPALVVDFERNIPLRREPR